MLSGVRFLWDATRGYRWRPAQSPYLRWRLETYTGKKAGDVRWRDFLALAWGERRQVVRFVRWLGEMGGLRRSRLSSGS